MKDWGHKKLYPIVILTILALLLGSCSPATTSPTSISTTESTSVNPAQAATDSTSAQSANTEVANASNKEPILVAFAYNGAISDAGWTWTHDQARKAVEEHFGGLVKTEYVESVPFTAEGSRVFEQFVADGAKMIIACSFWGDQLDNVSKKYPDVAFMTMSRAPLENQQSYYFQHWMPTYLIGVAAGMMTKTNKLGYIGAFNTPTIKASADAFEMGAKSVNPDAVTQVVLTNSWFDPPNEKKATEALIDSGVDFVFGNMNDPTPIQVAEERGVWVAAYNTDMRKFGPNSYVSSVTLDWTDFYIRQIQKLLDGTWEGGSIEMLPLGGGTDIDRWGDKVPQEVRDKVDSIRTEMLNGSFNPYVGPIKDNTGKVQVEDGVVLDPKDIYIGWNWVTDGVNGLDK
jgi:basic membrane lipoprotein Med (substrate-binding protein (PBP1-ABC) superfamily)